MIFKTGRVGRGHWARTGRRFIELIRFCLNYFQEYLDLDALEPQTPTSSEPPSTPRNSLGTEHDTDNDDRDIDNVFVDNANDILQSRENELPARTIESENLDTIVPLIQNGDHKDRKSALHKSSSDMEGNKKQTRVVTYRSPIHSDV